MDPRHLYYVILRNCTPLFIHIRKRTHEFSRWGSVVLHLSLFSIQCILSSHHNPPQPLDHLFFAGTLHWHPYHHIRPGRTRLEYAVYNSIGDHIVFYLRQKADSEVFRGKVGTA